MRTYPDATVPVFFVTRIRSCEESAKRTWHLVAHAGRWANRAAWTRQARTSSSISAPGSSKLIWNHLASRLHRLIILITIILECRIGVTDTVVTIVHAFGYVLLIFAVPVKEETNAKFVNSYVQFSFIALETFLTQCCGSGMFIPALHPGYRIPALTTTKKIIDKEWKYFVPKMLLLSSHKYGLGTRCPISGFLKKT